MPKDKLTLFIILNINCNKNPALIFCLNILSDIYEITVLSPDVFENKADRFPNVRFVNYSWAYKWIARGFSVLLRLCKFADFLITTIFFRLFKSILFSTLCQFIQFLFIERALLPFLYVQRLLRYKKLDGIICIDAGAMTAARIIKRLRGARYLYWWYEIYPNQFLETPKPVINLKRSVEREGCRHADLAIVTTDIVATLIRRRYKLYDLKHVIVRVCPPPAEKYADLETKDRVKFYYHGAYVERRGLINIIRAMKHVEGGILYFRGIGNYRKQLEREVESLNLDNKVQFLEPVPPENLSREAANFDVGISMDCLISYNSKFGIGFKVFENTVAGLAVLVPHSHQLREIIKLSKAGLTFSNCREEHLAEKLQFIVDNKNKIKEWKQNSRAFAEAEINMDVQGKRLVRVVENLVAGENSPIKSV